MKRTMSNVPPTEPKPDAIDPTVGPGAAGSKRSPLARLGCGFFLTLWFALLLTPCALFYLATNNEIRIMHSDIPQPHAHPRLLISLISEAADRGLRIVRSFTAGGETVATSICVETNVVFLLWESSGDSRNVSYCDCYGAR